VHHDETIGGVHHIPYLAARRVRELQLANGEPIPTLAEALEAVGSWLQVFVEVKSLAPRFDDRLFDALAHGPNPAGYAVHSFDHRIVRRLGLERPDLRRGVLASAYQVRPLAALEDAGATMLWQEWLLVDRALVDARLAASAASARRGIAAGSRSGFAGSTPSRRRSVTPTSSSKRWWRTSPSSGRSSRTSSARRPQTRCSRPTRRPCPSRS